MPIYKVLRPCTGESLSNGESRLFRIGQYVSLDGERGARRVRMGDLIELSGPELEPAKAQLQAEADEEARKRKKVIARLLPGKTYGGHGHTEIAGDLVRLTRGDAERVGPTVLQVLDGADAVAAEEEWQRRKAPVMVRVLKRFRHLEVGKTFLVAREKLAAMPAGSVEEVA